MTFDVTADAYGRFMGRFSEPLADLFVDCAPPESGLRALDVGCGAGALTQRLVDRFGAGHVCAVDPSASFVAATRRRFPDVDVRSASAEQLPFPDATFDAVLAQLVVHFMADPVQGLREMARVARPGGTIAACVWDHAGGGGPLSSFWTAVQEIDPGAAGEGDLPGAREGHLVALCAEAGLSDIVGSSLTVTVGFASFDDWWEPFTLGVGPAGAHVAGLDDAGCRLLRERCAQLLPSAPFEVHASAWCVQARARTGHKRTEPDIF